MIADVTKRGRTHRSSQEREVDSHGLTPGTYGVFPMGDALDRLRDNCLTNTSGFTAGVLCRTRVAVGTYERV
jgi:hypothetical protein